MNGEVYNCELKAEIIQHIDLRIIQSTSCSNMKY